MQRLQRSLFVFLNVSRAVKDRAEQGSVPLVFPAVGSATHCGVRAWDPRGASVSAVLLFYLVFYQ